MSNHDDIDYRTPAARAVERIAGAHQARPAVDANGIPLAPPTTYTYDRRGRLVSAIPAEPEPEPEPTGIPAPDPAQGQGATHTNPGPPTHMDVRAVAAAAARGRGPARVYEYDAAGKPVAIH